MRAVTARSPLFTAAILAVACGSTGRHEPASAPPKVAEVPQQERPAATPAPSSPSAAVASHEKSTSPHLVLGLPVDADPSDDTILDRGQYVISYNDKLHDPNWVAWRLTKDDLGDVDRTNDFRPDDDLPAGFLKVKPGDYAHSGYDQGHMCPSSHRTATKEMNSITFLMSNMQPQLGTLNRGAWARAEAAERDLAAGGKVVFIVVGGIFSQSSQKIGRGIAVPDENFRVTVVLEPGEGAQDVSDKTEVYGVIMPNDGSTKGHTWTEFKTSVDEVEKKSGYDILSEVEDGVEAVVEARRP